jgi:hypothetical protein
LRILFDNGKYSQERREDSFLRIIFLKGRILEDCFCRRKGSLRITPSKKKGSSRISRIVFDRKNPSESFLAKEMIFEDSKHPII